MFNIAFQMWCLAFSGTDNSMNLNLSCLTSSGHSTLTLLFTLTSRSLLNKGLGNSGKVNCRHSLPSVPIQRVCTPPLRQWGRICPCDGTLRGVPSLLHIPLLYLYVRRKHKFQLHTFTATQGLLPGSDIPYMAYFIPDQVQKSSLLQIK